VRELLGCFGCGGAGPGSTGVPPPGSPKRAPSLRARGVELEAASEIVDEDVELDSTPLAPGEVFLGGFLFKRDHGMLPVWQRRFVTLRHGSDARPCNPAPSRSKGSEPLHSGTDLDICSRLTRGGRRVLAYHADGPDSPV